MTHPHIVNYASYYKRYTFEYHASLSNIRTRTLNEKNNKYEWDDEKNDR